MIQTYHSAKGIANAVLFALLILCGMFAGCASDNIHMPDPDDFADGSANGNYVTFDGTLTTSLPEKPEFSPAITTDYVKIIKKDEYRGRVDLELGAFDVVVPELGSMTISIGTMLIEGVICKDNGDGTFALEKAEFTCQAGQYQTKGTLSGRCKPGHIELTLEYKPGSMPFLCHSEFKGTAGK